MDIKTLKKRIRAEIAREWASLGGHARSKALTKARRSAIAKKASLARWKKPRKARKKAA